MPFVSNDLFKNSQGAIPSSVTPEELYRNPFREAYDKDPDIARVQRETDLMNAWSAEQAYQNRLWQEEMSNTAHQREVADLKAAGLNPVLSANSGASTPNGSYATADSSSVSAIKDIAVTQAQAMSALALMQARGSGSGTGRNGYYGRTPFEKMIEDLIEGYSGQSAEDLIRNLGRNAGNFLEEVKTKGILGAVSAAGLALNPNSNVFKVIKGVDQRGYYARPGSVAYEQRKKKGLPLYYGNG